MVMLMEIISAMVGPNQNELNRNLKGSNGNRIVMEIVFEM